MQKVALVLSSGGARGFAHIGAIEALIENGFEISSISGASMGALIGGMYASNNLAVVKEWLSGLTRRKIASLVDVSFSMSHLVKGFKVIDALKEIAPDMQIEDLPIPLSITATDLKNGHEVIFESGSLYEAIRASISIPSLLRPMEKDEMILIDGGVLNPLPLNRVKRHKGDIVVAVNVGAKEIHMPAKPTAAQKRKGVRAFFASEQPASPSFDGNYYSILSKTFSLMIQQNTDLALALYPPDIVINIPFNRFSGFDYDKVEMIAQHGKDLMEEAIHHYHSNIRHS